MKVIATIEVRSEHIVEIDFADDDDLREALGLGAGDEIDIDKLNEAFCMADSLRCDADGNIMPERSSTIIGGVDLYLGDSCTNVIEMQVMGVDEVVDEGATT